MSYQSTIVNGASTVPINGNGVSTSENGVNGINGDNAAEEETVVDFPHSQHELRDLLARYQSLIMSSKEAKHQYDAFLDIVKKDSKLNNEKQEKVAPFTDPNAKEKLLIEKILVKISNRQGIFHQEQQEFYTDLKQSLDKEEEANNSVDVSLLEKQIVGLQLLSKDLDLPESFQEDFTDFIEETPLITSQELQESIIDEIFKSVLSNTSSANFVERAKSLGVNIPSTLASIDPMYSKPGNYYTEQIITSKISNRLQELGNLPANIGTYDSEDIFNNKTSSNKLKLNALIELKSLQLLSKQKQLKSQILCKVGLAAHHEDANLMNHPLILQGRRGLYLRDKIDQPNSHLLARNLEDKHKLEIRKKEHQKHVAKISKILDCSRNYLENRIERANKKNYLAKQINSFHSNTEKEESKKLEKTAKQRLQALKANDEEAYIKLLDQTKDHRITHLLKQTNSFLDTLAQAVKVQQIESGADIPLEAAAGATDVKEDTVDELREKIDYYQVVHRVQEIVTKQSSLLVGGQLKEYQIKGLQWMVSLYNNKLNGILADEMGLGKTIQSISLITYLIEKKHEDKFLVIVPLSTITNWTIEFEKWAPSVRVIVYKGSQEQRRSLQYDVRLGNFQVILTTYEYVIRERPLLAKFQYSHMIIDEGHRLKNANSKLSVTLKTYYRTKNRLILTGTPLQNNLPELWALLNFVLPKVFNSVKSFDEWFNTPFANTGSQEKIELTEEESLLIIRRLHKVLRPFLLRRLKKDVEKDLPDKVEKVLKCNLSGLQYVLYQQMLKHNALFLGAQPGGTKSGIKGLNNKIMQLRKICNHPFVFEEVEDVLDSSRMTNDLIWRTSGKFELLDRVLPKFKRSGHRVLMFFQMTQVMNIMEDFLRFRDMKYLRLDGATKAEDRQDMLKLFNAPDSDYFCFLLSTRAGGLGLNLQTADTVIIFDTDWNPHQDLQAQDRAHRIGQKNEVRILRLISNDSVEEVILERAHQKLDIDGKVIQAGKFDNKSTAEEQEAFLKRLLEAEGSKEENEENGQLDDEELNEILARSEDEKELFTKMDKERQAIERTAGYQTRLMEKDELPAIFTEDISHHFEPNVTELGRMREKKKVKYDDGLTEEQWLNAMDDDNDTVEDAIRRKEERMRKRRKRAEGGEEEDDDEEDEEDEEDEDEKPPRKKGRSRLLTPNGHEEEGTPGEYPVDEFSGKCFEVLDDICQLTSPSDPEHNVSEVFIKLPSRKLYPDYYQIISHAVSINQVRKAVTQEKFDSFEAFIKELRIMCTNAKTYNEEGSWVYDDATVIEEYLDKIPVV